MIQHENIYIKKIAHYVPDRRVTNEELIQTENIRMKASWVEGRLGIRERRWAEDHETTSDLVVNALKKIDQGEGPFVLSTISPDYLTPSTSSEVKRKIEWKGLSPAYDVAAACAGFLFALEMGALLLNAHKNTNVYVGAGEVRSRFLNKADRRTVFLFGDAAAACLLSSKKDGSVAQLLWTHSSTQSFGEPEILIPAGGAKKPLSLESLSENAHKIKMIDGASITEAVESKLIEAVQKCLSDRGESIDEYRFFGFHQGNGQLIRHVLGQLGANEDQTWINFGEYGNSSSASVAVVLSEAVEKGLVKSGEKALFVAMGAGYHLGIASLSWC